MNADRCRAGHAASTRSLVILTLMTLCLLVVAPPRASNRTSAAEAAITNPGSPRHPTPAVAAAATAMRQSTPPLAGMLITLSATGEDIDDTTTGSLVVRITLDNRTGQNVDDITVRVALPAGARASESGILQAGDITSTIEDAAVSWRIPGVHDGGRARVLAVRLEPEPGADGAVVFREATVRPAVTGNGAGATTPPAPVLRLNGLWGEGGLRRTVLPTGLTVFTRERPDTPTVSVRIAVRAGARDETEQTRGGSHWLEHAFFLGTPTRPNNQAIFNDISTVGGQTNASTGWEATDYWHLVPADQFDLALDVLADQLLNSTFAREAFERERRVVFEELKLRNDTPSTRAFDEYLRLVFKVSPLRQDAGGTIESVQSIPIETILAYRAERYVTGNMAVAASGNLRHDPAVAVIERAFAALPIGARAVRPRVPEPVQTEPRRLEIGDGVRVANIVMGWPAPGDDDEESAAMFILQDILGATGRRLEEAIRGRGLATAVNPGYIVFSDAGTMSVFATTQADRAEQVVQAILAQVQRIRDGDLSDEDVQTSLRAIGGRRALSEETNQGQTGRALTEVSGILDSFAEYVARLRLVTAADVERVARAYLDPANFTLVIVRS